MRLTAFVVLVVCLSSASCAFGRFSYRGIVAWEPCDEARASEIANGSRFLREETPDPKDTSYRLYTYAGSLYGSAVDVHLGCITSAGGSRQTIHDAFYVLKSSDVAIADAYMARVISELKSKYGVPETSPLIHYGRDQPDKVLGKRASFGCHGDVLTGYSLGVLLQYPQAPQSDYEVWLTMRFGGGVC